MFKERNETVNINEMFENLTNGRRPADPTFIAGFRLEQEELEEDQRFVSQALAGNQNILGQGKFRQVR